MNPGFYQAFWDVVREKVTSACLGFLNNGDFPQELNATNLVLIPKKKRP